MAQVFLHFTPGEEGKKKGPKGGEKKWTGFTIMGLKEKGGKEENEQGIPSHLRKHDLLYIPRGGKKKEGGGVNARANWVHLSQLQGKTRKKEGGRKKPVVGGRAIQSFWGLMFSSCKSSHPIFMEEGRRKIRRVLIKTKNAAN